MVVATGIINRSELKEQVGEKRGDTAGKEYIKQVFAFSIRKEAGGGVRFLRAEDVVTGEHKSIQQGEAITGEGERRNIRVAFNIHFRSSSSDVIENVIDNETSVELDIDIGIVSRIKFYVCREVHAGKIIGIGRRHRSVIFLKNNGGELLRDSGEGGGSADLNRRDAGCG